VGPLERVNNNWRQAAQVFAVLASLAKSRRFRVSNKTPNGPKLKNANASHPFNAMLNCGYAVLQSQLQVRAVADGFDPTLGVMHHGRRDAPEMSAMRQKRSSAECPKATDPKRTQVARFNGFAAAVWHIVVSP
jgi:CRISPR associated protein Cas1